MRELERPLTDPAAAAPTWSLYDYTSPGLRVVRPDSAFPHMRPGDPLHHPWKYLRRDVPHLWYADERFPLMGFMNRDEAVLLHNIALQFAGKNALEIGSWLGWSTVHLALGGVHLDVIDPAHDDPVIRASVEDSLAHAGATANLVAGHSPESIAPLGKTWSLFFIDGDHEAPSPMRDAMACLPYAAEDCAFVFHDLASPAVAAGLRVLEEKGFHVVLYQTAQIMGLAWRGRVTPVAHTPDPNVAWQLPPHLAGLPISGVDFDPTARRAYKQLREQTYAGAASRPSVCIVTSELIGPFKNGGVGTSMTGLAELLASDGLRVTVLYTGTVWSPEIKLDRWKTHYAARGIELEALTIDGMKSLAGPLRDCGFGIPSLVYDYLARHRFDVIHFNDCCGEGSLALAAKKLGLAFADSLLVVALHSPSRWVFELNHVLPDNRLAAAFDYAERLSLACADVLWSPSEYLLDWVSAHRFELPEQTFIQQYVMPSAGAADVPHGRTSTPAEIVFFGRLEERKGLRLFCNAIDALRDELASRNIGVTFLGKPQTCAGMPSLDYIAERATHWQFPMRTLTNLGQPEALQYLRDGAKLAVMPSPFDNSPCTVYEALAWGIPFLATRTGGIPELVADDDREHVLFDHSTEGLRIALLDAIEHGGWIAKPAISQDATRASWRALHAHWQSCRAGSLTRPPVGQEAGWRTRPTSVAVIIDYRPPANIDRTYASFASSPNVNRYIVIDRAKDKNYELELDAITEDFVLLIHAGAAVTGLQPMLDALDHAGIDGLIPAARHDARTLPPLGGSAAFALFEGATFTGAMLVRREALMRAKEGRTLSLESPFLGLADFCITRNRKIWPYPEAAIDLEKPVDAKSALPARIAAYDDVSADDRYYMLAAGYGAATRQQTPQALRRLALTAADLGLSFAVRAGSWTLRRLRRWMR